MKTETFKGSADSAYGKTLPSTVYFNGEYEAFENESEIPESEQLTAQDRIDVVNARRKAKAAAAARDAAFTAAGIAKPDPNSEEFLTSVMVKSIMKLRKVDEATAKKILSLSLETASQVA